MRDGSIVHSGVAVVTLVTAFVAAAGHSGGAQAARGHARVVQSTVSTALGSSTVSLADTGTLSDLSDARAASQGTGTLAGIFQGETLHAVTIGWPDQVTSEASAAGITLSAGSVAIGADFVMSRAFAGANGVAAAAEIEGLSIAGVPVPVTGEPNQVVLIPNGRVIVNEQRASAGGVTVNALHVIVNGSLDVVVGSASAGVQ